jgi:hypothetical protein
MLASPSILACGDGRPELIELLLSLIQPAAHLEEDFPLVAAYIRTLTSEPAPSPSADLNTSTDSAPADSSIPEEADEDMTDADVSAELSANDLNSLMAERLSEEQTNELMGKFAEVMRRCEEDGVNRDDELKQRSSSSPPLPTFCFLLR